MSNHIDPLSIDRLNSLPQVPAPGIWIGARIECRRQGEWIPGTIVGTFWDDEKGCQIDVDLDRPDSTGATRIYTDSHKIRLFPETAAAVDRHCARELAEIEADLDAERARFTVAAE